MRFKMSLMLAMVLSVGIALGDESAPNLYTLQLWVSPGGEGIARTIGPMTAENCQRNLGVLRVNRYEDIPPNMPLIALQCATQTNLAGWLGAYHCVASRSTTVPKHPGYRLWLYSCFSP